MPDFHFKFKQIYINVKPHPEVALLYLFLQNLCTGASKADYQPNTPIEYGWEVVHLTVSRRVGFIYRGCSSRRY